MTLEEIGARLHRGESIPLEDVRRLLVIALAARRFWNARSGHESGAALQQMTEALEAIG